ncbi:DNA (cytosine-5-)-methyltransferase [Gemella sanguinis M325]|jgi:DNA (cytosine-5-)-methyltransferase|uniref:Cytosine-specific methyltransferase n=1 Tax=Gemella sanguinis TaxID=84135 RepID=A0ABX6FIC0_9BACL|nr:DNA (cytosine-5-)-methyltransferase [Gemella sanguinis]EGF88993.1 DNA (cytosine-5-)-methyltransferase [Gemella sanguinis M325]QGS07755.1 DNA (cytosine-5-)-methyltransferase [Gemella sanguinis]
MNLDVVELFAGVGGFRVGLNNITEFNKKTGKALEKNGWNFVWANQYEPSTKAQHAFECYSERFQDGECSNEDINKVDKKSIPDHSLLVGGFPCQDYSVARSLSGEKGIAGKKGVLFWDIRDTLIEKNTPFVLLENVDRLLKSPASVRGRDFAIMLKTFDELGYYVQWRVINAGDYGMPQKRRRVFIFASKKNMKYSTKLSKEIDLDNSIFEQVFPTEDDLGIYSEVDLNKYKDAVDVTNNYKDGKFSDFGMMIDGQVFHKSVMPKKEKVYTLKKLLKNASKYNEKDLSKYFAEEEKLEKWKYLKGSKRIERQSKSGHKYIYSEGTMSFPENMDEPARTMLTSEGTVNRSSHIIFDDKNKKYRILTEVECEMIQMFPPNWTNTMPSRRRYFMMGNALVTGIISRMEPTLKNIIENE